MAGLGQPQLLAQFEVVSSSGCTHIKGQPENFFFGVGFYDGLWQTPAACKF